MRSTQTQKLRTNRSTMAQDTAPERFQIAGWENFYIAAVPIVWIARPASEPLPPTTTHFWLWDALAGEFVSQVNEHGVWRHVGPQDASDGCTVAMFFCDFGGVDGGGYLGKVHITPVASLSMSG